MFTPKETGVEKVKQQRVLNTAGPSVVAALRLLTVLALLLTNCEGDHQYIAIPGGNMEEDIKGNISQRPTHVVPSPTVAVVSGTNTLVAGQSVTVHIDFSTATDFKVTQLMLLVLNLEGLFSGYLEVDLGEEEIAAGAVDLEVFALDEEPQEGWCQKDQRGQGACAIEVDEGVTGLSIIPANDNTGGFPGATVPITLAPLAAENTSCADFTIKECCAGSPGISAVACYVLPPCGCPTGTSGGGKQADGTTMCICP